MLDWPKNLYNLTNVWALQRQPCSLYTKCCYNDQQCALLKSLLKFLFSKFYKCNGCLTFVCAHYFFNYMCTLKFLVYDLCWFKFVALCQTNVSLKRTYKHNIIMFQTILYNFWKKRPQFWQILIIFVERYRVLFSLIFTDQNNSNKQQTNKQAEKKNKKKTIKNIYIYNFIFYRKK